jgi:plastocyanin
MKVRKASVWVASLTLVGMLVAAVSYGCGDEKPAPAVKSAGPAQPAEPVKVVEPVKAVEPVKVAEPVAVKVEDNAPITPVNLQDGAVITGVVKAKDAPRRKKIRMDSDPKCAALHADPLLTDEVVVDPEGNTQWAFVYVKKGLEGKKFEVPKTPAVLDQKGCRYDPHVFGVMVGQEIHISNSDDLLHNVHAVPFENKEFNKGQPQKGMVEKVAFTVREVMVKVKCEVHGWMGAHIGVLDHPFHSTTDAKGKYEIKGLPAGKYTIEVWHEKYKSLTQDIEVKEKESKTADFELVDKKE